LSAFNRGLILLVAIAVAAFGLIGWDVYHKREKANRLMAEGITELTQEDLQRFVESQAKGNPRALAGLANSPEERKNLIKQLKELLAVSAEARKTGFAEKKELKSQLELTRNIILAQAFENKLKADAGRPNDQGPPFGWFEQKDVDDYINASPDKAKYEGDFERLIEEQKNKQIEAQKKSGSTQPIPDMPEEQRTAMRGEYMKIAYGAAKAREAGLDKDKNTELQFKMQESIVLANAYAREELAEKINPTKEDIDKFIKENPKYDKNAKKAKAEELLQRANAGEDFAALADEFSEDPGNKDPQTDKKNGGFYDWKARSGYVKEFSEASWGLEPGQISGVVETQFGYHIIKLEEKRTEKTKDGKDEEQVKVRHILISTMVSPEGEGGNPMMSMPMPMDEAAKAELTKKKREELLAGIASRNPITVPEDFTVIVPEGADKEDELPYLMEQQKKGDGKTPAKKPEPAKK
jgi:hypothetical protein